MLLSASGSHGTELVAIEQWWSSRKLPGSMISNIGAHCYKLRNGDMCVCVVEHYEQSSSRPGT